MPWGAGDNFGRYLSFFEGYALVEIQIPQNNRTSDAPVYCEGCLLHLHVEQVVSYQHVISGLKLDVVESTHWNPLGPISDFHSTSLVRLFTVELLS